MEINTLGDRIRQLRNDKGLGLREFARKVDISAPFLSDIEQGRRYPSVEILNDIAQALEVPLSKIESYDSRAPLDDLKKMAQENPSYGFALRTLAENPEEFLKIAKRMDEKKGKKIK